jgi:hypothetical protein
MSGLISFTHVLGRAGAQEPGCATAPGFQEV